jgi:hypothetical protein
MGREDSIVSIKSFLEKITLFNEHGATPILALVLSIVSTVVSVKSCKYSGDAVTQSVRANNIANQANGIANSANEQSRIANENYRKVEKLDITPQILVFSNLCKKSDCNAKIEVKNVGKVNAVHVFSVFYVHSYYDIDGTKLFQKFTWSDWEGRNHKIEPGKSLAISLQRGFFENITNRLNNISTTLSDGRMLQGSSIPKNRIFLEFFIKYSRESDLTEFSKRAFYFLNSEDEWVNENDKSVQKQEYEELRQIALKTFNIKIPSTDEIRADRTYSTD